MRVAPEASLDEANGEGLMLAALDQLFAQDSRLGAAFDVEAEFFPSAFRGLNVAAQRFIRSEPVIPPNPIRFAPVFALNFGTGSDELRSLRGLQTAVARLFPGEPMRFSPIFFGLLGGTVDEPVT